MKKIITLMLCAFTISSFAQKIEYVNNAGFKIQKDKATSYLKIYTDSVRDKSILIKTYSINGILQEEGYYKRKDNSIKHGEIKEYYCNGNIKYIKNYKNSLLDGEVIGYDSTGTVRRRDIYKSDELITGKCYTSTGKDTTYYPMIVYPTFKGENRSAINKFIGREINYPMEAMQNGMQGDVFVNFIITKEGQVCNIKIVYSNVLGDLLELEALRIIKQSSKYWQPGYIEGVKADIALTVPVTFRLR